MKGFYDMKLNLKWVSEIIGDDYKTWKNGDIITIECQTGTGKTFFVTNKLLPYAIKQNKKILYIANRIHLKRQMKIDVAKIQNIPINYKDFCILDEIEVIGNITITSYQKIQNSILNDQYHIDCQDDLYDKYLNFDYIVWDECHFIIQDAAFNNKTVFFHDYYLKKCNKNCIILMLSATMDYVKQLINEDNIITYSTGKDYSYIEAFYFNDYQDIINTINNDISGNKWLFFVNDISLAVELLGKIKDSKFICSQHNEKYISKMDQDELNNIIVNSKFNCKCLIATKALDNGINIIDPLVKNVVILTFDKVDFIQMLGRKRIDINNPQTINLYIMRRSIKSFYTRLNTKYYPEYKEVELYKNDINSFNRKYDKSLSKLANIEYLFYKDNDGWKLNKIGYLILCHNIEFCRKMIQKFYNEGKNAFIKEQLSWIKLKYNKDNWIEEVINNEEVNDLINYLNSIVGKRLFKNEQKELIEMIGLKDKYGRIQKTIDQFNSYFKANKIPFMIISKTSSNLVEGKKKSFRFWEIVSINDLEYIPQNVQ